MIISWVWYRYLSFGFAARCDVIYILLCEFCVQMLEKHIW